MRMQNRAIFCLNLLLCAGIAAVWALTPAWRRRPATAATSVKLPEAAPVAAVPAEAQAPHSMDGEAQALKGEIKSLRAEANAELGQIVDRQAQGHSLIFAAPLKMPGEPLNISLDDAREKCPEGMPQLIYDKIVESLVSRLQESAAKRIQARQVILDALAESSATDEEYRRVRDWFAQLDEFDANVTLRDYTEEEFPRRHPYENMELCNILWRLWDDQNTGKSQKRKLSLNELLSLFTSDSLGDFVLLPEDAEKLDVATFGEAVKGDVDDE